MESATPNKEKMTQTNSKNTRPKKNNVYYGAFVKNGDDQNEANE